MKIALCLSGQPRGLRTNIPRLLNGLLHPTNITDIFIHTWFSESVIGTPFQTAQPNQLGQLGVWDEETIALLEQLQPKSLVAEEPNSFSEYEHLIGLPSAVQPQLASNVYSVYMANKLKTEYERLNGFEYDLVVRARVDCEYDKPYNLLEYLDENWKNVLHVPYMHQHMRIGDSYPISSGGSYSSLSDTFAYGSSDIMNKFSSIYPDFENIYNAIYPYPYGECYYGYQVLHHHKVKISMQPINYRLVRA